VVWVNAFREERSLKKIVHIACRSVLFGVSALLLAMPSSSGSEQHVVSDTNRRSVDHNIVAYTFHKSGQGFVGSKIIFKLSDEGD
jgi:hypothetical protein